MAWTTITSYPVNGVGPYRSSGGNYYAFGRVSGTTGAMGVFKSSTIGGSYTEQDSGNRPQAWAPNGAAYPGYVAIKRVGDLLHIVAEATTGSGVHIQYCRFNMATDSWVQVNSTNTYYECVAPDVSTKNPYEPDGVFIDFRADGDLLIFHQGVKESIMGADYDRSAISRLESGTWTTAIVDPGGEFNRTAWVFAIDTDATDSVFGYGTTRNPTTIYSHQFSSANAVGSQVSDGSQEILARLYKLYTYKQDSTYGVAFTDYGYAYVTDMATNPVVATAYTGSWRVSGGAIETDGTDVYFFCEDSTSGDVEYDTWDASTRTWNGGGASVGSTNEAIDTAPSVFWDAVYNSTDGFILIGYAGSGTTYYYTTWSPSTGPTATGSLTNAGQVISGAGEVAIDASGALVHVGPTLAGVGAVFIDAAGALVNVGQSLSGTGGQPTVTGSGSLANVGQLLSGLAAVYIDGSGSLTNTGQSLSGAADVLIDASGALSNLGQTLAGAANVLVAASGSLSNAPQSLAGTGSGSLGTAAGGLVNAAQSLSGAVSVLVDASGALSNIGQTLAGLASVYIDAAGSLVNVGQALSGAGLVASANATGSLTNAPQSLSGAVDVLIDASGTLANLGQALAGLADVFVDGAGSLVNAPQSLSGAGGSGNAATGGLVNQPQSLSGAATVVVDASGALINAGQLLAGLADVFVNGSGGLTNVPQSISGTGGSGSSASGGLVNVAQSLSGIGVVAVSAVGSLVNAPQALGGLAEVTLSNLLYWNEILRAALSQWNDTDINSIDTYNSV